MAAGAGDDAAGYAVRMAGLVRFREEGRVVCYRLADGFAARLLDDRVLIPGRLAPRRGGHGPR
jgi:hypothetical protein